MRISLSLSLLQQHEACHAAEIPDILSHGSVTPLCQLVLQSVSYYAYVILLRKQGQIYSPPERTRIRLNMMSLLHTPEGYNVSELAC